MQVICETCGLEYYQARGRKSKYCPMHRHANHNQEARRKYPIDYDPATAAAAKMLDGIKVDTVAKRNAMPMRASRKSDAARMAIGMSMGCVSDRDAAEAVGLGDLTDDELAVVTAKARANHTPLIERKTAATSEMIQQFIALAMLRLRDEYESMNPAQLALASRAAVQALNMYQGGSQAAYTNVVVTWPGKPESDGSST